jgi:hypothetical protein
MPPASARLRAAAGSGPGWAMTRCSKSMASSWAWWGHGGVGRVTVQVVETAITPQLALSERGRGAGREPLLPGAPLHPPWGGRPRQGAAVVATSIPPSSGLPPTGSRPHSACHRGPCARAHQDGAPVLPHSWSARPLRPARTALTPRAASKWPGMSRRFWAHRCAGPLPSPTRPRGAGGS